MTSFSLGPSFPTGSIILEVNWNGEILNSWHSNSSDMQMISEAIIVVSQFYIYLISCLQINNYLFQIERLPVPWISFQQLPGPT